MALCRSLCLSSLYSDDIPSTDGYIIIRYNIVNNDMEWREFFYFNRSDRSVVLSIIVFAAVVWLLVVLFDNTDDVGKIGTAVTQDSVGYSASSKGYTYKT